MLYAAVRTATSLSQWDTGRASDENLLW